jgi:hypothetical protein
MNASVINSIKKKIGIADIVGLLAERLSGSELSSLMLAVYERKTEQMQPAELLTQYRGNRLVQPSVIDMIGLLESELAFLRYQRDRGFTPLKLSPVAMLGSCSVVAPVNQDKVVSAVRNTEIVADATNSVALHVADLRKQGETGVLRFCTTHRHVRAQRFAGKQYLPHFAIGCMVTAGRDTGSFGFECDGVAEHVGMYIDWLREEYGFEEFGIILKRRGGYDDRLLPVVEEGLHERCKGVDVRTEELPAENGYYQGVQWKLTIFRDGREREIADGGLVDWSQRLLGNRKERMLISGVGLEWLFLMKRGLM